MQMLAVNQNKLLGYQTSFSRSISAAYRDSKWQLKLWQKSA